MLRDILAASKEIAIVLLKQYICVPFFHKDNYRFECRGYC